MRSPTHTRRRMCVSWRVWCPDTPRHAHAASCVR